MSWITNLLRRLIPENIAGILGIIGIVIPLIKEALVAIVRVVAVLITPLKTWIAKLDTFFANLTKAYDSIKRVLLGMKIG